MQHPLRALDRTGYPHLGQGWAGGRGRLRLASAGFAMVLAASACQSGGKPPAPAQPTSPTSAATPAGPAPCSLLTPTEAETFLGRPIGPPRSEADRCTWSAADGNGFVTVTVNRPNQPRVTLDAGRASDSGESVKGIGEEAYVALPGAELGVVAFVDGPLAISILVRSPTRDRTALLNLAGTAATRA